MIKIKKVYINNFKGIAGFKVVDFGDLAKFKISILSGPKGFGNPTIFDAIELCLTGQLNKVLVFKSVQHSTTDKIKPHFQNTDGKDVIVKLLLEDSETNATHTIIKYYDDTNSLSRPNSRKNNPVDNEFIIQTFYSNDENLFDEVDVNKFIPYTQEQIESIIYGTSNLKLQNVYYLFNYIQQEDNLYFLRKSEKEKGDVISFLFNIEKEQADYLKLNDLNSNLKTKQTVLGDKIKSLEELIKKTDKIEYRRIFSNTEFEFDKEELFNASLEINRSSLNIFLAELEKIINFKNNFSIEDYDKSLSYAKVNNQILNNIGVLEASVFSKIYNQEQLDKQIQIAALIKEYSAFKNRKERLNIPESYIKQFLGDNTLNNYKQSREELLILDNELGVTGKIVSDLMFFYSNKIVFRTFRESL